MTLEKQVIKYFLQLKVHFQLKVRKIFRIQLNISLDRQALSEYDIALLASVYK